ncbi:sigma-54 interaction domain-containing protein [Sedimentibacter sp. MB31-C6]|uniref:sigma-54 interaction domain-containing protein n=1 Tax=Sedimentibacter sp. MB31-C6 TaxID=3109366 RepID=UPI002DDDB9E4|nr:sigma 54-interacting transcriptional regulator [Sedimentibacter sp. MB36-C1]WSI05422.1 sigma 54-interacting transcriptional regulator [Sedimentibacter sp. MB36-C1]
MKLQHIYTGFVITDNKFNVLFSNEYFKKHICKNKKYLNKKITIYFNNIDVDKDNYLYPVKYIDNTEYYVIHEELKLYKYELYAFFFYDFSLDKELEKQIKRLNRQRYLYNEMFNKLNDGIYITNEEGTTIYVNDAFLNLSGLTREQIIGKTVYNLRNLNVLPNSCCAKVIETKGPVSTINNYYKGQRCLVSGSPIFDENGKLSKTIAVIRDVSELDVLMKSITKEKNFYIKNNEYDLKTKEINKEPLLILNNDKMKNIYSRAKKIASVDSTILILGETGVGKDFIATYIYNISNCKDGKFIKINCSAVPEHLLESEFFGYEEGAFTGAQKGGKKGLFEEANGGILYLDEIGDMPYTLQVKLLSAINDRIFYRIGGTKTVEFNARIIAATNADLKQLVEDKKFRADLYYRLNVVRFVIPPLRLRKEDIIPLAHEFLEYYNNKYGKNCFFTTSCLESFLLYEWPGNIRELKNIIERLVLMSDDAFIDANMYREHLMMNESEIGMEDSNMLMFDNKTLKEKMNEYEREIIENSLAISKNMKEAASKLGIDISTLVRKKQKYNL